jgi:glycosyltransferase involved in cell wall biosynthesis/GT2 family glycosyltransferase
MRPVIDLPGLDSASSVAAPLNVCFVTREYLGYHKCGGIGTAVTAWAEALCEAGHRVTVLLTQEEPPANAPAASAKPGNAPAIWPLPPASSHLLNSSVVATAYRVFTALASRPFDVVYFHDWGGQGHYCCLAKRQGLALEKTLLCVVAHGSTPWTNEANQRFPEYVEELEAEFMERTSIELADVLISPSRYMLSWMTGRGWRFPARTYQLPYQSAAPGQPGRQGPDKPVRPNEIVFFGRIETRKGATLFCDALDLLARRRPAGLCVTFLGKPARIGEEEAGEYVRTRASSWPFPCKVLGNLDQGQALAYLEGGRRLAVMPALDDNSPNTVYECLAAAIPFLASDVGGVAEIIAPEDRKRVLFPPRAEALAQRLFDALAGGTLPAKPALAPGEARQAWLGWHVLLGRDRFWQAPVPAPDRATPPLVSVCLTHRDRPGCLRQALDSLAAQDYPNFEVVLVDDGSLTAAAHRLLGDLEAEFAARGWTLARQENRYLGAARNRCAALAKGEYLLFMDDDNLAKPGEISTFVKAARAAGADVLTCAAAYFESAGRPGLRGSRQLGCYVPLGGALGPGFIYNAFGDANALVKKDVFCRLGGFTEDAGVGFEDWEFFAKAVLAGFRLQAVPLVLFEYRSDGTGMRAGTARYPNLSRAMRPYLTQSHPELAPALRLCQGFAARLQAADKEIWELKACLARARDARTGPSQPPACAPALGRGALSVPAKAILRALGRVLETSLPAKAVRRLRRDRDVRLLRASPLFDAAWYLLAYPDVAAAGIDPAVHYLAHGAAEGRNPGPGFDSGFYLHAHTDVLRARMNPLVHYLRHGLAEGRRLKAPDVPPPPFASGEAGALEPAGDQKPAAPGGKGRLVICPAADWAVSGAHAVTEQAGKALGLLGWDFRILFTKEKARILESSGGRLPDLPHEFYPVDHLGDVAYEAAMREYFARLCPCVLLCGCDFRANLAASRLPGVGVFVYSHSDEQVYYDQSQLLSQVCQANICVSRAIEGKVRRLPGLEGKTRLIPNGGLHLEEVRFRTGRGLPELSLVYTGRLIEHQKRVLDFIALARALEKTGQPYRLSLIGQDLDGCEARLRRELAGPIRQGSVRLPGRLGREELLRELDGHNFFLLLSEFEGFSISLAEAMGRGCVPVVTSIESGNGEIIRSGRNGMIMPHRDYERWAAWLGETSRDEAAWLGMSRAASETVRSSFTVERQALLVDALLRDWWRRATASPGLDRR